MTGLKLDPDYAEALEKTLSLLGDKPAVTPKVGDVEARRTATNRSWPILVSQLPPTLDVEKTHVGNVKSYDGYEVPLYRFAKKGESQSGSAPAIVYTHGGGYIGLSVELFSPVLAEYVSMSGVQIFAMDYRLSPEHSFPAPLEDCYAGLQYVHENATQFGIDPERIAIMGESAGGGLCAGAAILARNRGLKLAKQLVINGSLDDRNIKPKSFPELQRFATCSIEDNITCWDAYLGPGHEFKNYIAPPAAPARLENMSELAPLYLDVGALDIYRDEGIQYAMKVAKAGVEVELHVYPGVPHSFEILCPRTKMAKLAMQNRVRAMGSF
ncbi:hypothetical protein LTR36_005712 [Oleoguttula mirabilis]|uniref:Alpha/beta hydrolase fold-3 domain-containing protein n=1 Tax=Oleoguttula mirabilis TaxID=1507867 RepID=A0AAV9JDS4_9PEZI|nr:hypothetical protein LTR36_005712 [Oleoguttula mirabilis]